MGKNWKKVDFVSKCLKKLRPHVGWLLLRVAWLVFLHAIIAINLINKPQINPRNFLEVLTNTIPIETERDLGFTLRI